MYTSLLFEVAVMCYDMVVMCSEVYASLLYELVVMCYDMEVMCDEVYVL